MKETPVQQRVRLAAAANGDPLWRNNVGSLVNEHGVPVRYGLCNESKEMNKIIKSSDLIGPTTVLVTPDMVGRYIAIFTAIETKKTDWFFDPNDLHAVAQKAFHDIVIKRGGLAGFATSVEDYRKIVMK